MMLEENRKSNCGFPGRVISFADSRSVPSLSYGPAEGLKPTKILLILMGTEDRNKSGRMREGLGLT